MYGMHFDTLSLHRDNFNLYVCVCACRCLLQCDGSFKRTTGPLTLFGCHVRQKRNVAPDLNITACEHICSNTHRDADTHTDTES